LRDASRDRTRRPRPGRTDAFGRWRV